tara:strand:+ start:188 stop:982 length:795 start_codon:yes stop_codon:yes gene_type:complete
MKKYLVIGNPIDHSLSPKLHNYWIKKNNLDAEYSKRQLIADDVEEIIKEVRKGKINGINVTIPFKKTVLNFIDQLTPLADQAQSVNTIYKKGNKVIGENTDIGGFELSLQNIKYDVKNKKAFILGSGGVVSSIILALERLGASKIFVSNRTGEKVKNLKKKYPSIEIIEWGQIPSFDLIINATSLGLKKYDKIKLNYDEFGSSKFFYDLIYNPSETNFLLQGKKLGNKITNGKMMFIYQAQLAFNVWHNIVPKIDSETIQLLNT